MYQAYKSMKPVSNKKQWLPYVGDTIDEVKKLARDNELYWNDIYIAPVTERQSN